jgi:hypothetical protein
LVLEAQIVLLCTLVLEAHMSLCTLVLFLCTLVLSMCTLVLEALMLLSILSGPVNVHSGLRGTNVTVHSGPVPVHSCPVNLHSGLRSTHVAIYSLWSCQCALWS